MKLWLGWLVVMAVACTDESHSSPTTTATGIATNAVVIGVIDGDTIDVSFDGDKQRVRLIGIDTPETKKPNTPIQCFGPEASTFTKHLLTKGTKVFISRDSEARDDYGRLLGYAFRSEDGLFVNLEIVQQGYARLLNIAPNNTFADDFVRAAHNAEAADLGLWAACSG